MPAFQHSAYRPLITIITCISMILLHSCNNSQQKNSTTDHKKPGLQKIIADSSRYPLASRDHRLYQLQKEWCKKLSLYELEKGTDSFELRLWKLKGDYVPVALNILKWYKGGWTQYRYECFQLSYQKDRQEQRIDSFTVHTCDPPGNNWSPYLDSLDIKTIWTLPSQCELPGNYKGAPVDAFSIELADKRKYKFLFYADPASFVQEKNHRLISNFIRHFTGNP